MTPSLRARFITVVAVCCLLSIAPRAWSQEQPSFAKTGTYVGVTGVPDFTLDGITFDGSSYYKAVDRDEIVILPRLEPKTAMRGVVGFRSNRGAFEIGYEQTKHVGTFAGSSGKATFHSLNFDERIFALTRGRIQPFGLVGFSIPWLTVTDGSALDADVADARFHGFGVNTEVGVTVYATHRLGVSTGYRYRSMWFDHATGVSDTSYRLRPRFRETSGSIAISAFFTF